MMLYILSDIFIRARFSQNATPGELSLSVSSLHPRLHPELLHASGAIQFPSSFLAMPTPSPPPELQYLIPPNSAFFLLPYHFYHLWPQFTIHLTLTSLSLATQLLLCFLVTFTLTAYHSITLPSTSVSQAFQFSVASKHLPSILVAAQL